MTVRIEGRVQTASVRRIQAAARRIPQTAYQGLRGSLQNWGGDWELGMKERFTAPLPGPGSDNDALHNRTGRLRRALTQKVTGASLNDLRLTIRAPGVRYANLQEFGGEVRPKSARFLTIPTPGNLTASGASRYGSARAFISAKQGQTFFLRTEASGRDALLLMWNDPSKAARKASGVKGKGTAIPMFLLVRRVEIPGPKAPTKKRPSRLGFYDEWKKRSGTRSRDLARLARSLGRA